MVLETLMMVYFGKSCQIFWKRNFFARNQGNGPKFPGFFNQAFLQNKSVKQCNSLHVDTNSQKLEVD